MSKKKAVRGEKRVSPMKGRKISLEDRGPDAPKLGRAFSEGERLEKHNVMLSLRKDAIKELMKVTGAKTKSEAIRLAIYGKIDK